MHSLQTALLQFAYEANARRGYEDAAISGVGMDRSGFQRHMADAASPVRDFDVLLLDDSSRLSRSLPDVIALHQRLAHYGVRVIAVSQGIDTRHEESEILIAVHGITDSLYVKELGKKTHRGLEGKFLKGLGRRSVLRIRDCPRREWFPVGGERDRGWHNTGDI